MPHGIIIFGANGVGKSTLGRELAQILNFKHMDIEDYYFINSEIPYSMSRTREEVEHLMLSDIEKHDFFIISAVIGDLGEKINSMYDYAVFLSAPLETRIRRIKQRAYEQYGERVCVGGDMYEQELKFVDFVASRSLKKIDIWAKKLTCPIICIDGTKPISENVKHVASEYLSLFAPK